MLTPPLAVATITLARTPAEEIQLRDSLSTLAGHGWPIWVTDGGSSPAFLSYLHDIAGPRVNHSAGLVPQILASLRGALGSGAPSILYAEPDKAGFFATDVAPFVATGLATAGKVLSVAARSAAAFETFPPHQRHTEATINAQCSAAFGAAGDYSYGPFLMPREVAAHLAALPAHLGWGWRHAAFAIAHRLGYSIALMHGDYHCPDQQRHEDAAEVSHRDRQLKENLAGLSFGLACQAHQAAH